MSLRDRDLISIQEARELAARAAAAQKKFAAFSQEQVDAIVEACAKAAAENAEPLARTAVEETGFGNVPDKIVKNTLAAVNVPRAIRGMRTVGILREDREKGIVEVASPIGVVAAVIPSTNPTSTAIYKTLISVKAQNAIVLSPHPSAIKCICQAATLLERAALTAGAPEGLIQCMQHTTLEGTRELMRRPEVGVILATGGTGLVRAAYGSGKPAYGVGPGNVPAFIERTADVRKAVADIIAGKTFDYGTICSSEQAIVAEESVRERALEECRQQGAYFLSPEEMEKVARLVFLPGSHTPNTKIVGRAATVIAEMAGIKAPPATRVLIARLEPEQVGARVSALGGKVVADSCVLFGAESRRGNRALPQAAGIRRAGTHLRDPLAESLRDSGIRRSHARVSRGREQRVGARLDRLFDEPFSGDDARLRRARREHHFGQYRPAALDEREAHRVGNARRRASHGPCGPAHGGSREFA